MRQAAVIAAALTRVKRPATRGAGPIALSGVLSGVVVYTLVASSPPLYETQAVLSAAAPALLEQYQRLSYRGGARGGPGAHDDTIELADFGDVGALAARVRAQLGPTAADSETDLHLSASSGELAVVVRGRRRHTIRQIANLLAHGIVSLRDATTLVQRANARTELRLIATLARTEPRLRPREAALLELNAALDQLRRTTGGGMTVLRQARTPTKPVGPRVARDVVLATVFGILVALTLKALWRAAPPRLRRVRPASA